MNLLVLILGVMFFVISIIIENYLQRILEELRKIKYKKAKPITVYHDKDGKIYTYDEHGDTRWLFEVLISDGDNIAKIINKLIND